MDILANVAWGTLVLVHASPATVVVAPRLLTRLYGVDPTGDSGVLLTHRGALFLAVIAACTFALFRPEVRRAASVVVTISVVGFLIVYARAGMPEGALRTVALMDLAALAPLALVSVHAWRGEAT